MTNDNEIKEHRFGSPLDTWIITTKFDGDHGYEWTAARQGVLWAKGWMRCASEPHVVTFAKNAGCRAYAIDGQFQAYGDVPHPVLG